MDIGGFLAGLPLWYGALLFSLTCHEAAHAYASHRGGDPTAYLGGQRSLDPVPHIRRSPFGMVVVPLAAYILSGGGWMIGWASAPYNPAWAVRYPKRAAVMSLAGPASNLALAFLSGTTLKIMLLAGWVWLDAGEARMPFLFDAANGLLVVAAAGLFLLFTLNLLLTVFNLMPFPPFDGQAIPSLFMTHENRMKFQRLGREFTFVCLIVAWTATGAVMDRLVPPLVRWLFQGAALAP